MKEFEQKIEKALNLIGQINEARRKPKPLCEVINEFEEEEKPNRCTLCPLKGRVSPCACQIGSSSHD